MGQGIPPTLTTLCRAPEIAAVVTIFNVFSVFSYDAMSARDSNLSPSRQRVDPLR